MACGSALNKISAPSVFSRLPRPAKQTKGPRLMWQTRIIIQLLPKIFFCIRKDPYYPRQDAAKAPTFTEVSLKSLCPRWLTPQLLGPLRYRGIQEKIKSIEALPCNHLIIIRCLGRISKFFTDCNWYALIIMLSDCISGILSKVGRLAMAFFGKHFWDRPPYQRVN